MWHPLWWSSLVTSNSLTPWAVTCQVPLFMGFPRKEYWSGLPFPSPGDLPNPGIESMSPVSAGRFFTSKPLGKPGDLVNCSENLLEIRWLFPGVPLLNSLAHLFLRLKAWWNVCLCYCFHLLYAGVSEKETKPFPSAIEWREVATVAPVFRACVSSFPMWTFPVAIVV